MASFNPIIAGTPGQPPAYNPSVAETFSWIPINNDESRPLFARAVYSVNRSNQQGQDGFDFVHVGRVFIQDYIALQTVTATQIKSLTADNSYLGDGTTSLRHLTATVLPPDYTIYGPFRGIELTTGAVIAYK
jgi:hypothetical protein